MDILRGDIFFIQKFDRYQDNEVIRNEGRPAVIVSNNISNERGKSDGCKSVSKSIE